MKKKISLLSLTIVLTLILFTISTYLQKKIIQYEPTGKCIQFQSSVKAYEKIEEDMLKEVEIPLTVISVSKVAKNKEELIGKYAKQDIYLGQLAMLDAFDTKENLSIFEAEVGKEKISVKIKAPENAVSYQLKTNSKINIGVTLRSEYAKEFLIEHKRVQIGTEEDGYTWIKLLENITVLGVFDSNGVLIERRGEDLIPDTILIAVTSDEAQSIQLIREIATFHITEIGEEKIS